MVVLKKEVWTADFSPSIGSEINKIRPCLIISPNLPNRYIDTVIVVPLTSTIKEFPSRVNCKFLNRNGQIMIDQIRTISKKRLIKKMGEIDSETIKEVYEVIKIYFK
jgi:mRNA interferase MazF